MPTVSVLMAVRNGARHLPAAVESILTQSFTDFEFLIIDDGSDDGVTLPLLRKYAEDDRRIRLISRPNRGLTTSLNEGLALATAEFIARMDGDDISLPQRLQLQVDFLRNHPEVVLLGGAYELIDGDGRPIRTWYPPADDESLQRHCLQGQTPICHPLAMMRASAVRRVGGYDESFPVAQDLDLWLRLGEVGRLACLPEVLLRYRQHEASVSERKQRLQIECMRRACEAAYRRRGVEGQYRCRAEEGWRPVGDRASRRRFLLQYGWWAFNAGHRQTARHYGWRAIAAAPWRLDGWKLLGCALLKRPLPRPPGQ
ncbi:MAG: glycosyltransferase [Phycisphaerae bacterium]|nr:glycosyltransferase [Phycisphaerae bacterium]MDW8260903.1 glycosyltransferase [Phycisphaerales bacterium]